MNGKRHRVTPGGTHGKTEGEKGVRCNVRSLPLNQQATTICCHNSNNRYSEHVVPHLSLSLPHMLTLSPFTSLDSLLTSLQKIIHLNHAWHTRNPGPSTNVFLSVSLSPGPKGTNCAAGVAVQLKSSMSPCCPINGLLYFLFLHHETGQIFSATQTRVYVLARVPSEQHKTR